MSQETDKTDDEQYYRAKTINGQVTVPAPFRGEEPGYLIKETENGLLFVPAEKEEKITIEQTNE